MQLSLNEPSIERTDGVDAAGDELVIPIYEERTDAFQGSVIRHQIPQTHLLDVFSGFFLAFPIAPGDQRKQWPPCVTEQRHTASAYMPNCIDRIVQQSKALTLAAFGGRLTDEYGTAITLPIQIRQPLDDVG